jgi:hypothetical protein
MHGAITRVTMLMQIEGKKLFVAGKLLWAIDASFVSETCCEKQRIM